MDGSSAEGTVAENGSPPTNRFSIGLSSTGVFLISLAIQAIGLGATFFLARNIGFNAEGKALLGTVQLYLIIASSINGIGDLRIGTAYVFFVARGRNATEITGTYLVLRLGMVAVAGVFLFLLGVVPGTGFTWAHTSDQIAVLAVFMVLPILWSIQTVYTQLTVAQGNSTRGQLPLLVESLVRTPILVWAAFENRTLEALTLAYAAGAVASTLMSLPAVARNTRAFSRSEAVALFRYAWPLMGSLALLYLANNTAPLIVNADVGTVGLNEFLAANAWRILALSLPAAVAIPLFPHLSGLHRQGEFETVRAATWKALRYTAMIVIPGVIALITYRSNLLNITTNATYVPVAAYPLAILAASVIPAALSQIIGTSLNAIGRQRLELYLTSLQVVALFGTTALLIDPIELFAQNGIVAVSWAVLASSVAALALNAYFMERLLAVQIQLRTIAFMTLSAGVSFFALSRLNRILPVSTWYQLLAALVIGFGVYFVGLALLGELSREDVRYITGSFGLPRRIGDVLARLCWRHDSPPVNTAAPGAATGLQPTGGDRFDESDLLPPGGGPLR